MQQGGQEVFLPFLLKHHTQDLLEILAAPSPTAHYAVRVSLVALAEFHHGMVDVLQSSARLVLGLLEEALGAAQEALLRSGQPPQPPQPAQQLSVKHNVHARLVGAALLHDSSAAEICPKIGSLTAVHIDRLVTLSGTVVKTGLVKALEAKRVYECTKCKHRFLLAADLEMGGTVNLPKACPSNREKPCAGTNFRHLEEEQIFTNYQEVRLQESAQCLSLGAMPHSITVLLQHELAGSCQVGDDVEVTGVVIRQFGRMSLGERCHISLALEASSVVKAEQRSRASGELPPEVAAAFEQFWDAHAGRPMLGRAKIVASLAPQLYGLHHVKLSTLLMLIGGVPREDPGGGRIRGECHMLLVGDPGTGKSQFMKFAAKLSQRAVMTTGRASSAAGLTAAAVQEGNQWTLEAGALVLADGGLCCIDEFDGIREADRASIHEAMEQQTVSVAKATMVVTLQTRTSIFGTCNPRGNKRYNPRQPLSAQLNISGPLMSRFDIVLLLLDDLDPEWDDLISDHILESHQQQGMEAAAAQHRQQQQASLAHSQPQGWTAEVLRQYVQWVRQRFAPVLSQEAEELLSGYYQLRWQQAVRQASRTTVRMLESLVRLAQAHARLMARHEVLLPDAVVAISLMDGSAVDSCSVLPPGCAMPTAFEDDPDACFAVLMDKLVAAVRAGGLPPAMAELLTWGDAEGAGW